jgi:hypothetical protein
MPRLPDKRSSTVLEETFLIVLYVCGLTCVMNQDTRVNH